MIPFLVELRARLLSSALVDGLSPAEALAKAKEMYAWVDGDAAAPLPVLALPAPAAAPKKRAGGGRRARKPAAGLEELRAELARLWGEGRAPKKIAKQLKRSEAWVYLNAKALKLPPRRERAEGALAQPLPKRPATGSVKARKPTAASAFRAAQAASSAAAPIVGSGPELTAHELLKFLREIGHKASALSEAGWFVLEGKKTDAIGLLEAANVWRRRNAQPPFSLKAG